MDENGLTSKVHLEHLPKETKVADTLLAIHFIAGGILTILYHQQGRVLQLHGRWNHYGKYGHDCI